MLFITSYFMDNGSGADSYMNVPMKLKHTI